jgi:hypothetical protein
MIMTATLQCEENNILSIDIKNMAAWKSKNRGLPSSSVKNFSFSHEELFLHRISVSTIGR